MAAKCALEKNNRNILVAISLNGKIEYRGSSDSNNNNTSGNNGNNNAYYNNIDSSNNKEVPYIKNIILITFDFHGLYVKECLEFTDSILSYYNDTYYSQKRVILRFIVGKGNHSIGKVSRLGPALKRFLNVKQISYTVLDGEIRARINV